MSSNKQDIKKMPQEVKKQEVEKIEHKVSQELASLKDDARKVNYNLASKYFNLKKYDEAIKYFSIAKELGSNSSYFNIFICYLNKSKELTKNNERDHNNEALAVLELFALYEKHIADPSIKLPANAYFYIGFCIEKQIGSFKTLGKEKAEEYYQKAKDSGCKVKKELLEEEFKLLIESELAILTGKGLAKPIDSFRKDRILLGQNKKSMPTPALREKKQLIFQESQEQDIGIVSHSIGSLATRKVSSSSSSVSSSSNSNASEYLHTPAEKNASRILRPSSSPDVSKIKIEEKGEKGKKGKKGKKFASFYGDVHFIDKPESLHEQIEEMLKKNIMLYGSLSNVTTPNILVTALLLGAVSRTMIHHVDFIDQPFGEVKEKSQEEKSRSQQAIDKIEPNETLDTISLQNCGLNKENFTLDNFTKLFGKFTNLEVLDLRDNDLNDCGKVISQIISNFPKIDKIILTNEQNNYLEASLSKQKEKIVINDQLDQLLPDSPMKELGLKVAESHYLETPVSDKFSNQLKAWSEETPSLSNER